MSLANDLARRESLIAFWCFVVAHLEWPDMLNILPGGGRGASTGRPPVVPKTRG